MNKNIVAWVVVLIVLAGGAFWGGMQYQKSQTPARGNFAGQFGGGGTTRTGGAGSTVLTTGQILSVGSGSMTLQLSGGSSKIVLIGTSTQIMKEVSGSASDLSAGTNVAVTGTNNSDGSVSASSIQIRPAGMMGFGAGRSSAQTAPAQ